MQTMNQPALSAHNATPRRRANPAKMPDVQKASATDIVEASNPGRTVEVEFKLDVPGAQSVAIAGSFNDWNARQTLLARNNGVWTTRLKFPRGKHEYRFVVDGEWGNGPSPTAAVANPLGGA